MGTKRASGKFTRWLTGGFGARMPIALETLSPLKRVLPPLNLLNLQRCKGAGFRNPEKRPVSSMQCLNRFSQ